MKKASILTLIAVMFIGFSAFTLGGIRVTFSGLRGGEITKAKAIECSSLKVDIPKESKVVSFSLLYSGGDKPVELSNKGNELSAEMKSLIKKCTKGSWITFKNIKVSYKNGKTIPAPTIKLKLI